MERKEYLEDANIAFFVMTRAVKDVKVLEDIDIRALPFEDLSGIHKVYGMKKTRKRFFFINVIFQI